MVWLIKRMHRSITDRMKMAPSIPSARSAIVPLPPREVRRNSLTRREATYARRARSCRKKALRGET